MLVKGATWRHKWTPKKHKEPYCKHAWIILKFTDWCPNITLFLHVHKIKHGYLTGFISGVIRWNCFNKMWYILLLHMCIWIIKKQWFTVSTKRVGWSQRQLSRVHYDGTMLETMHNKPCYNNLTHWGRVTHICVGADTNIGSDNDLSPGRCQAIIWTSASILLIGPLGTNFSGILSEIHTVSFKKMHFKTWSAK